MIKLNQGRGLGTPPVPTPAQGVCAPPTNLAPTMDECKEAECVPTREITRETCPQCKGRGYFIKDILSGSTTPCPRCQPVTVGWEGDFVIGSPGAVIVTDTEVMEQSIDSQMPFDDTACQAQDDPSGMADPACIPVNPAPRVTVEEVKQIIKQMEEDQKKIAEITGIRDRLIYNARK